MLYICDNICLFFFLLYTFSGGWAKRSFCISREAEIQFGSWMTSHNYLQQACQKRPRCFSHSLSFSYSILPSWISKMLPQRALNMRVYNMPLLHVVGLCKMNIETSLERKRLAVRPKIVPPDKSFAPKRVFYLGKNI